MLLLRAVVAVVSIAVVVAVVFALLLGCACLRGNIVNVLVVVGWFVIVRQ